MPVTTLIFLALAKALVLTKRLNMKRFISLIALSIILIMTTSAALGYNVSTYEHCENHGPPTDEAIICHTTQGHLLPQSGNIDTNESFRHGLYLLYDSKHYSRDITIRVDNNHPSDIAIRAVIVSDGNQIIRDVRLGRDTLFHVDPDQPANILLIAKQNKINLTEDIYTADATITDKATGANYSYTFQFIKTHSSSEFYCTLLIDDRGASIVFADERRSDEKQATLIVGSNKRRSVSINRSSEYTINGVVQPNDSTWNVIARNGMYPGKYFYRAESYINKSDATAGIHKITTTITCR